MVIFVWLRGNEQAGLQEQPGGSKILMAIKKGVSGNPAAQVWARGTPQPQEGESLSFSTG